MQEQNLVEDKKEAAVKPKKTTSLLFKTNKKGRHVSPCLSFLRVWIMPLVRLVYPFRVLGAKKVADGPCVYVSNHYRMIDPMYLLPTTKEGIHFIAKKESGNIPVLRFFINRVKTIYVNRDGNDIRAIMDAQKCLRNGDKIAIYPEGKRNTSEETFLPFKPGCELIAIRAKVPVIPVVIYEKTRIFRRNTILVGDPIDLSEYYGIKLTDEVLKEAGDKILSAMKSLREEYTASLSEKRKR